MAGIQRNIATSVYCQSPLSKGLAVWDLLWYMEPNHSALCATLIVREWSGPGTGLAFTAIVVSCVGLCAWVPEACHLLNVQLEINGRRFLAGKFKTLPHSKSKTVKAGHYPPTCFPPTEQAGFLGTTTGSANNHFQHVRAGNKTPPSPPQVLNKPKKR
ncbi:hypothetical protein EI94DRAFT_1699983 [Lactarius quietus]|nr:hypothetical protein EI94DRAFT_1699983 [Lactarius quietus]